MSEDPSAADGSKANAASIALLLEHDGKRALLTGDATSAELLGGLALLDEGERAPVDLVKLPHHGSRNNVSRALVQAVDCPKWVFSSDGTTFRHPDAIAVSRVVRGRGWGAAPGLQRARARSTAGGSGRSGRTLFGYTASYGVKGDGITVTFE